MLARNAKVVHIFLYCCYWVFWQFWNMISTDFVLSVS